MRVWLFLAAANGFVAVALGAAAAHALAADPQAAVWVEKAARYQMYHALALLAVALLAARAASWLVHAAGAAFVAGVAAFSGSLYGMAFAGWDAGPVTPAGGLALMLGWLLLAAAALRR